MKTLVIWAALITTFGLAVPASAAVLLEDKIVVSSAAYSHGGPNGGFGGPNLGYLQVGELLALQAGTGIDVALASNGGEATAANDYSPNGPDQYSAYDGPDKAIDGLYPAGYSDPNYPSYPGPYGIYHSAGNNGTDTLTVTFDPTHLAAIEIYGRADGCCDARDLYYVTAYSTTGDIVYHGTLDARTNGFAIAALPEPSTWIMLLLGFFGLGFMVRGARRNGAIPVA